MAPDKIYVKEFDGEVSKMWSNERSTKTLANVQHEYIRKDTLLAFLNERRKGLSSGDSFVAGERKMLKEIIEKIESL